MQVALILARADQEAVVILVYMGYAGRALRTIGILQAPLDTAISALELGETLLAFLCTVIIRYTLGPHATALGFCADIVVTAGQESER